MLQSERKIFEEAKEQMESRMASELMAMEEKLMEQQIQHQELISSYKEKLEMISHVLKGSESAEEKIKLIEEVVDIGG